MEDQDGTVVSDRRTWIWADPLLSGRYQNTLTLLTVHVQVETREHGQCVIWGSDENAVGFSAVSTISVPCALRPPARSLCRVRLNLESVEFGESRHVRVFIFSVSFKQRTFSTLHYYTRVLLGVIFIGLIRKRYHHT